MTTAEEVTSRAAPFLAPIAGPEPGGQNASFDPRYETVRNELAKLDSPTGGEVDWKMIGRTCDELLQGVTKDFLIASHKAYALLQLERWRGLATGLAVVAGMLDTWWEQGFPPVARLRGRGNALDWLVARLEVALPNIGLRNDEIAAFELVRTQWSALWAHARERLAENCPAMGGVGDVLERLRINLPPETLAAASASAPTAEAPPAPAPSDASAASAPPPASEPVASAPAPAPAETSEPADPLATATQAAAKWLQPIAGPNPAGVEARYEPGFEAARLEIAKLDSVTDNVVDWKLVHDNAGAILIDKSKDLLMGGYLAFAKLKLRGLGDAVVGMQVLSGMIDGFWEGLQPERLRGRANALAWYVAQLEPALAAIELTAKMRADVLLLEAAVKRLANVTRERFDAEGPSLAPISDRVKRMLLAVPEEKPAPPPPPPPPPPSATPATTAAPTPAATAAPMPTVATVDNPENVGTFLQETGRALVSAGNLLRTASNANPTAYRLVRVGLYLHLVAPPPADAGGKTQIPPLPPQKRQQLATLEQNSKWDALIDESESSLGQFRFCLDLHRFTHRALEGLGEGHAPARQVVASELAALLARMPALVGLLSREGTPLVEPDTRKWLGDVVLTGTGGAGVAPGPASDGAGAGEDAKVISEARGLFAGGKPAEALKLLQQRVDASTNARQRFVRRLALAHLMLDGNQALLARGLFAALERELREHELLEWEPELTARCLEGFVRAIRAAAKAGARYDDADRVYERLCLIDPGAAARLAT